MNKALAGLTGCAACFDDVVVFSDTWEVDVAVNLARFDFAKVTYLVKVVSQSEVRPVQGGGH